MGEKLQQRLKKLVNKSVISQFKGNYDLEKKIVTVATKVELKAQQDKFVEIQGFNSSFFCIKNHLEEDSTQND